MNKKAQISVFGIIGLVLLILFIVLLSINKSGINNNLIKTGDTYERAYKDCLKTSLDNSLKTLAKKGRLYPENTVAYSGDNIYLLDLSLEEEFVTIKELEEEISIFIKQNITSCLNQRNALYQNQGLSIEEKEPKITVQINKEDVLAEMNYPLELSGKKTKNTIPPQTASANYNLKKLQNTSDYAVEFIRKHKNKLNTTFLVMNGIYPMQAMAGEKSLILKIEHKSSFLGSYENSAYRFAIKQN